MMRILVFLSFLVALPAQAVPLLYTFEGTIFHIQEPDSPLATDAGLSLGDKVTYRLLLDFDAPGYAEPGGSPLSDILDTNDPSLGPDYHGERHFFYAEYISGSALNGGLHGHESLFGYDDWVVHNVSGDRTGGLSEISVVDFLHFDGSGAASEWTIGSSGLVADLWGAMDHPGAVRSDWTIVAIDPFDIPLPGSPAFLLLGLAALGALHRRRYSALPGPRVTFPAAGGA